ncbi:MAG TPA: TIGR03118 family protein [Sphingomicrobium sp.]|nr:TIGR03118 family protein [Sphingomicrobium sp.]
MNYLVTLRSLQVATIAATSLFALSGVTPLNAQTQVSVTNLVSNGAVPAATIDPNLVNPWGLARSPTSPFWISDNGAGVSTLYNGAGTKVPLTVTIPPPVGSTGTAAPTGIVFNGSAGSFQVSSGGKTGTSAFIFSTEDGTLSGWAPSVNPTQAILAADNSTLGAGAVYKGLAIASTSGGSFIYASDFRNGLVEQFDSNFNLIRSFTDPGVAPGYAPFGAQVLDGHLFVTYALQNAVKHDDVAGAGNGYVDIFNFDGTLLQRLVSQGGALNSPWGLDIAPTSFGADAGKLLVGNFGDGTISIFDLLTGNFMGKLLGTDGNPIEIDGLWALMNGNGGNGGDANKVYFTAGLNGEQDGLFGVLAAVPEPSSWALMLFGFGAVGLALRRKGTSASFAQLA